MTVPFTKRCEEVEFAYNQRVHRVLIYRDGLEQPAVAQPTEEEIRSFAHLYEFETQLQQLA